LRKAEAVVEAAEAEPERFGKLLEDMDRRGRADACFRRLNNIRQSDRIRAEPPPLPTGPFYVGSIDVPWPYETDSENPERRAVLPYPTMTLDAIRALPMASLMASVSILWVWAINRYLREAFGLLDCWGFQYSGTMLTWGKNHFGLGDYLRGQTEHAILGVRGRPVMEKGHGHSTFLDAPDELPTLLRAPMRAHSEKPDEFYALVESLCPAPAGGYLEMFARKPRPGWVTWGDEAPHEAPPLTDDEVPAFLKKGEAREAAQ
jgi:N6-adenosine-specific RNA methylase IME4